MKKRINLPKILSLSKIGNDDYGYLSLVEKNSLLPFIPKRIYWIYKTPEKIKRGGHYHHKLQQIIICVNGKLKISLENNNGFKKLFELAEPNKALYIPSKYWRDITFENSAILLCIASEIYDENDYVRDYQEFKNM